MNRQSATSQPATFITTLLTVTFGVQLLRAFLPMLIFVLRDRFGWSAIELGLLALLLFLTSALAPLLNRWLGAGRMLATTAVTLTLTRLLIQWWTGDPLVDLLLAGLGVAAFGLFLPTIASIQFAQTTRNGGDNRATTAAILSGLLLEMALHGSGLTYDLLWQHGLVPALLITLLGALQIGMFVLLRPTLPTLQPADSPGIRALAWSAFGPFLGLQLLLYLNLARLTALTGWSLPLAFLLMMVAHLTGIGLLYLPHTFRRGVIASGFVIVVGWLLAAQFGIGGSTAVTTLLGIPVTAGLLHATFDFLTHRQTYPGIGRTAAAHTVGNVLLVIVIFATYARFDIVLPFDSNLLPLLALLWLGIFGLMGLRGRENLLVTNGRFRLLLPPLALLLIVPIWQWATWQTPQTTPATSDSLRVMTYNLHNGFDPQGLLDLEALAQVIEAQNVDIVGLQEVSRGWVINGSVEMVTWLEQRLGMTAVFTPTADDIWGIAILSRVPIRSWDDGPLPPDTLLLRRGWQRIEIETANGEPLTIINTHLQHVRADSPIRQQQVEVLLQAWANTPRTVLTGDFNATPTTAEMNLLWAAGWRDAVADSGLQPGLTSPAPNPNARIDYILTTPDLTTDQVAIPNTPASDHLGVAATIK